MAEAAATGALAVHAGVAETVVGGALLRIRQDAVGFVDFLEAGFGAVVAVIAVGMVLHRLLAESGLQRHVIDGPLDFQHFVIATLAHCTRPDDIRISIRCNSCAHLTGVVVSICV